MKENREERFLIDKIFDKIFQMGNGSTEDQ